MDPESQELQLQRAGVPWENFFRDIGVSGSTGTQERRGWHRLNSRLPGGDTLVVVAIDRIGRTWQDTVRSICSLRDRGVKIRSLAEAEAQWTRYLEADEGSPESFFGQVLVMFAAWVADQDLGNCSDLRGIGVAIPFKPTKAKHKSFAQLFQKRVPRLLI